MGIFRKRKTLMAIGAVTATVAIGVPAAVVFATKPESGDIGRNIEFSIEERMLSSIKLMTSTRLGEFNDKKIQQYVDKLSALKEDIKRLNKEYSSVARTKLPTYGIINDVIKSPERFDDWEQFAAKIHDVCEAINKSDWDGLGEALFDTKNGGKHKLLSESYNVQRFEVSDSHGDIFGKRNDDGTLTKDDVESFKIQHSFVSFSEYVHFLKYNEEDYKKSDLLQSIIYALNLMTGDSIAFDKNSLKVTEPDLINVHPAGSIVYFIKQLEKQAQIISSDDKVKENVEYSKSILNIWQKQMVPAWDQRYAKLESFYNPENSPIGEDGDFYSRRMMDTYYLYQLNSADQNKDETLAHNIGTFLGGDATPSTSDSLSSYYDYIIDGNGWKDLRTGEDIRHITNWEYLKLFFGIDFEWLANGGKEYRTDVPKYPTILKADASDTEKIEYDAAVSKYWMAKASYNIESHDDSLTWQFSKHDADINGVGDSVSQSPKDAYTYWFNVVMNIFDSSVLTKDDAQMRHKIIYQDPTDPDIQSMLTVNNPLWTQLIDTDIIDAYDDLESTKKEYEREKAFLLKDPFRVGVNVKTLEKVGTDFDIKDDWNIKVDSFIDRNVGKSSIDYIKSILVEDKDKGGYEKHTDKYDIKDGFVFPKGEEWLVTSSDKFYIDNLHFKDDSKLKKWESNLGISRMYQPQYNIIENSDDVDIEVDWRVIERTHEGGFDD